MDNLHVYGFQSPQIIGWGDSVTEALIQSLQSSNFQLHDGDVVVITSKVISMEEESSVWLEEVVVSDKAKALATTSKMDPKVVQLVLDEANGEVYGAVFHAILAKTPYGLSANAGIDLSNCPDGYALLLPRKPDESAEKIRNELQKVFDRKLGVLITDSRTIPLKRGTTAIALGVAGFHPLIDDRGKKDLYDYTMTITTRAIADNISSVANMVMGETNERRPFAVVRGADIQLTDEPVTMQTTLMPEDQCLYFSPLLNLIRGTEK
ncbi:MAG: coenzyme F420-0:L-glutamate ligase [Candidatus Kariarchaeaceae archaeon]